MHEFPAVPVFDPDDTVLLFPDAEAKPLSQVDVSKFRRAVFIDSTWQQASKVRNHKALKDLPCVMICQYNSVFWRYQVDQPKTSLATIEAIYYLCREYQHQRHLHSPLQFPVYAGEFDNLVYYFMGQYRLIQDRYTADRTKRFTSLHYDNYIKYERSPKCKTEDAAPLTEAKPEGVKRKGRDEENDDGEGS